MDRAARPACDRRRLHGCIWSATGRVGGGVTRRAAAAGSPHNVEKVSGETMTETMTNAHKNEKRDTTHRRIGAARALARRWLVREAVETGRELQRLRALGIPDRTGFLRSGGVAPKSEGLTTQVALCQQRS